MIYDFRYLILDKVSKTDFCPTPNEVFYLHATVLSGILCVAVKRIIFRYYLSFDELLFKIVHIDMFVPIFLRFAQSNAVNNRRVVELIR